MADETEGHYASFLGTGWSFPPRFHSGGVVMLSDEDDIASSLRVLFGTAAGERLFQPSYGLCPRDLIFEPVTETLRTSLTERIKIAMLIHEPRVRLVSVDVRGPSPGAPALRIAIEYEVRSTNSRYNLVFPFYRTDASEVAPPPSPRPR